MKKRIKIDSVIVFLCVIATGIFCVNKRIYFIIPPVDNALDFLGVLCLLKGVLLRMMGRGYKKKLSKKSADLVTSGLYQVTRNPMYLGSFYIGAGFVFMVWPWWSFPLFVYLFYIRFKIQVEKEESYLSKRFGQAYKEYCETTPRIFPDIQGLKKVNLQEVVDWKVAFSTKEKRGLFFLPLFAVLLETAQEQSVFGTIDIGATLDVWLSGLIFFIIWFLFIYFYYNTK
ncbi:MAG: isoprenylcysteine carboxylmethyltransferase family protein [Candidatus Omnitrophica bacterium]|nr:isoprenylcysteine carboxylmethyltransferase family protein [Candidatus Omnitrophota bacterium]